MAFIGSLIEPFISTDLFSIWYVRLSCFPLGMFIFQWHRIPSRSEFRIFVHICRPPSLQDFFGTIWIALMVKMIILVTFICWPACCSEKLPQEEGRDCQMELYIYKTNAKSGPVKCWGNFLNRICILTIVIIFLSFKNYLYI